MAACGSTITATVCFHILPDGEYQRITTQNNLLGDRVGAWFQSSDGGIWVGVDHGGLARLRDRKFQNIGAAEGLPSRIALSVSGDTNGRFSSVLRAVVCASLQNGEIVRYLAGSNDSANFVFSIAPPPGRRRVAERVRRRRPVSIPRWPHSESFVGCARHQIDPAGSPGPAPDGPQSRPRLVGRHQPAKLSTSANNGVLPAMRALAETP